MKQTIRRIGIIAVLVIISFGMAGCGGDIHTHDWVWKVTTPATCTTEGVETNVCSLIAAHTNGTRPIAIDTNAHDWGAWQETSPLIETLVCNLDAAHTGTRSAFKMVQIPGGTFEMGKNLGTAGGADETPLHNVTLTGFRMGAYPVTQAQYHAVIGSNPSDFTDAVDGESGTPGKLPVEQVSWYDAIEFCNALSTLEGLTPYYTIDKITKDPNNTNGDTVDTLKWTITINAAANGYRLPTEAQWEYAAKGGNPAAPGWTGYTYSGSDDLDTVAWHSGNSGSKTHEVGKKAPNTLGLYDMSGNVFECCWDWYNSYASTAQADPPGAVSSAFRVSRGGSWNHSAGSVRSAYRYYNSPSRRYNYIGFRLVRPQ